MSVGTISVPAFPVLYRAWVEAETNGEIPLRQAETLTDRPDVDALGQMAAFGLDAKTIEATDKCRYVFDVRQGDRDRFAGDDPVQRMVCLAEGQAALAQGPRNRHGFRYRTGHLKHDVNGGTGTDAGGVPAARRSCECFPQ